MRLTEHQLIVFLAQFAAILLTARVLGEIARRFRQPAIVGELLTGLVLGPTLLGRAAPGARAWLFPTEAPQPQVLEAVSWIGAMLLLLVAGMEVEIGGVRRQARTALLTAGVGLLVPAVAGGALAQLVAPVGMGEAVSPTLFTLFLATAIGISALPVIARTLFDLKLLRTDVGIVILSAATLDDLAGWLVFAVILALAGQGEHGPAGVLETALMTFGFAAMMLTVGRRAADGIVGLAERYAPNTTLTAVMLLGLTSAMATQAIGVHAVFGAFLCGVAVGHSPKLRAGTREVLEQVATGVFAPLFFGSMGMKADFVASFRPGLVAAILLVAVASKLLGAFSGARLSGLARRDALAVATGLNARGAMEVILATLALQAKLITPELFVALVIMALTTSLMAGPLLARLTAADTVSLSALVSDRSVRLVAGQELRAAVRALADAAVHERALILEPSDLIAALVDAERVGVDVHDEVGVVRLRLEALDAPFLAVAVCPDGVRIGARVVRLLVLLAGPRDDGGAGTSIQALVGARLGDPSALAPVLAARTPSDASAALRALLVGAVASAPTFARTGGARQGT